MPSAWGVAWGTAWGSSWGTVVTPPLSYIYLRANLRPYNISACLALYTLKANIRPYNLGAGSIMSITSNIQFAQGEDIPLFFTMTPIPSGGILGWTIVMYVANNQGELFQISCAILSGAAGTFTCFIPSADTALLAAGSYTWEVRRTDSGFNRQLANGSLSLLPSIVP